MQAIDREHENSTHLCAESSLSIAFYQKISKVCGCLFCRPGYWFWDSVVLLQTLALSASQVLATALDEYYQLTIMLMVLVVGITLLAHLAPFQAKRTQSTQVMH